MGRGREKERKIDTNQLLHLLNIHWLILVHAVLGIESVTLAYMDHAPTTELPTQGSHFQF